VPGLTFLNTVFLAGLAAAALPVIIHLLHRQPARPVDFSWLKFIKALQPSRTRRVKFEDLLLLIVRVLVLVCLSLALARPTLTGGLLGSARGRARSSVCIVLDTSYSMSAREGDGRLFDLARARALDVVAALEPGDDAMVILAERPPEILIGEPIRDMGFVRRRIEAADVSAASGDAKAALAEANERLQSSANLNREIYFVTDGQAAGWSGGTDTTALEIDPEVSLYWITAGTLPTENVAVERVERVETLRTASASWVLQTVVRNLGAEPRRSLLVELQAGGEIRDQALVDVEAGGAVSVLLRMDPPASESVTGWVRVAEDAIGVDDVRYFCFSGREAVDVLLVTGGPPVARGRGADVFLLRALDPDGDGSAGVSARSARASEFSSVDLDASDVVILADVDRLDPAQAALLEQFVRLGGGVLIWAGPSLDLGFYNRTLLPEFLNLSLVGPLGGEDEGFFSLRPVRAAHPIFEPFEGRASSPVGDVHFRRVMKVEAGEGASVLAEFAGAGPALVEGSHGAGRALFFASSADGVWSDLPLSGGFVPLVHEVVRYLAAGSGRGGGSHPVGGAASAALSAERGGAVVGVDPTGEEVLLDPRMVEGRAHVRWEDLPHPGIYVLRWGEDEVGRFAANVRTEESDLGVMPPETVHARIAGGRVRVLGPETELETEIATLRYGRELASAFLWAAFAFLALESVLIRGRPRADMAARVRREVFR